MLFCPHVNLVLRGTWCELNFFFYYFCQKTLWVPNGLPYKLFSLLYYLSLYMFLFNMYVAIKIYHLSYSSFPDRCCNMLQKKEQTRNNFFMKKNNKPEIIRYKKEQQSRNNLTWKRTEKPESFCYKKVQQTRNHLLWKRTTNQKLFIMNKVIDLNMKLNGGSSIESRQHKRLA